MTNYDYEHEYKHENENENENENDNENENTTDTLIYDNVSKSLIDKLNLYQRGLTNRIRYITMIPVYTDKRSFKLHISTIKLDGKIKYKNIIEYQNKKNNFTYGIVKLILMNCRCRLLLKVRYLLITKDNVILNIQW